MNENQGQLMPDLCNLPGPRPFQKRKNSQMKDNLQTPENLAANSREQMRRKKEMEQENKRTMRGENVEDIVSKTAEILSGGKTFGGWTDNTSNTVKENYLRPSYSQMKRGLRQSKNSGPKNSKTDRLATALKNLSDPVSGPINSKPPLTKIGPDSSRPSPQYSKIRREDIDIEWVRNELYENDELYGILPEELHYIDNLTEEELLEFLPLVGMAARWAGKKVLGGAINMGKKWIKNKVAGAAGRVAGAAGRVAGVAGKVANVANALGGGGDEAAPTGG